MNKEIKAKWLEALRSGKYEQGINFLRIKDRFCCLGVLCDIIDNTKWLQPDVSMSISGYSGSQNKSMIPYYIELEIGLGYFEAHKLANMNDNGKSFSEIADFIE